MSGVLEKSLGGLLNSLIGSTSGVVSGSAPNTGLKSVSFGCLNFVERLEAARKISRQEEEELIEKESREWIKQVSTQNVKDSTVADILCRSLIAMSRGHLNSDFHIHAIKLSQSNNFECKKIGYLYISQTLLPQSDLTMLMVNTVHRDVTSPNLLQISMGLSLVPLVMTPELSPSFTSALALCLANQQAYVRKRAAIMCSSLFASTPDLETVDMLLPRLLHLQSDSDPSVVIAAVFALTSIYKILKLIDLPGCSSRLEEMRQAIGSISSHVLLQASGSALPKGYNLNQTSAPFVQVQMLKSIQTISSRDWAVPSGVLSAVQSVFAQAWGGRDLTLYATLLEAINTVSHLPKNDILIRKAMKVITGFLKSSHADFKYVGIKALSKIFSLIEDSLNSSHLETVVACLENPNQLLQSKTLELVSTMANDVNYMAICNTLSEHLRQATTPAKEAAVQRQIASLLRRINVKVDWCIEFMMPFITSRTMSEDMCNAFTFAVNRGLRDEPNNHNSRSSCINCINQLLAFDSLTKHQSRIICSIVNTLLETDPQKVDSDCIECLLNKSQTITANDPSSSILIECIKNCGLHFPHHRPKAQLLLVEMCSFCKDLDTKFKIISCLGLLNNVTNTFSIVKRQRRILSGEEKFDLTLSFLDSRSVTSLEKCEMSRYLVHNCSASATDASDFVGKPLDTSSISSRSSLGKDSSFSIGSSKYDSYTLNNSRSSLNTNTTAKGVWSPSGRLEPALEISSHIECDSEEKLTEDQDLTYPIEVAQEADEGISEATHPKFDLTKALLEGLGLSPK